MWNVYVIMTGKCETEGVFTPNLTTESVENIQNISNKILKSFTRYSNWIWVDSSFLAKTTGFHLKQKMMQQEKVSDFYVDELLDSEKTLQLFIDKRLKQLACKNNVVIVSEEVCQKLVEMLNGGKCFEVRDVYHFKYDRFHKAFTLCKS